MIHRLQGGWIAYAISLLAGLALGAVAVWALIAIGRWMDKRYAGRSEAEANSAYRLLYVGAFIWIFASIFLGMGAGALVMRIF